MGNWIFTTEMDPVQNSCVRINGNWFERSIQSAVFLSLAIFIYLHIWFYNIDSHLSNILHRNGRPWAELIGFWIGIDMIDTAICVAEKVMPGQTAAGKTVADNKRTVRFPNSFRYTFVCLTDCTGLIF